MGVLDKFVRNANSGTFAQKWAKGCHISLLPFFDGVVFHDCSSGSALDYHFGTQWSSDEQSHFLLWKWSESNSGQYLTNKSLLSFWQWVRIQFRPFSRFTLSLFACSSVWQPKSDLVRSSVLLLWERLCGSLWAFPALSAKFMHTLAERHTKTYNGYIK